MYSLPSKLDAGMKTPSGWKLAFAVAPLLAVGMVIACIATPFFIIKPLTCALFHPPPDLKPLSSYPRAQQLTAQQFPVTSPLEVSQKIMFQTNDSPTAVLGFYSGTLTTAKWFVG